MTIYPLIVLLVSTAFCAAVARQYLQRRRPYQLLWAISLAMAAGASLAYIVFLTDGKSEIAFRLYYILGALLMPAYLGMGSLLLAARTSRARNRLRPVLWALLACSAAGIVVLLVNPIDAAALAKLQGEPGTGVYKPGLFLLFTIVLNTFGALAVIGVALYSGWQAWRRNAPLQYLSANGLIAGGTIVISAGSSLARLGNGGGFWLAMAVGWVVIFSGFLLTFSLPRTALAVEPRGPVVARA